MNLTSDSLAGYDCSFAQSFHFKTTFLASNSRLLPIAMLPIHFYYFSIPCSFRKKCRNMKLIKIEWITHSAAPLGQVAIRKQKRRFFFRYQFSNFLNFKFISLVLDNISYHALVENGHKMILIAAEGGLHKNIRSILMQLQLIVITLDQKRISRLSKIRSCKESRSCCTFSSDFSLSSTIRPDASQFHAIQWNSLKFFEILWNSLKFFEILWNSLKLVQPLSEILCNGKDQWKCIKVIEMQLESGYDTADDNINISNNNNNNNNNNSRNGFVR